MSDEFDRIRALLKGTHAIISASTPTVLCFREEDGQVVAGLATHVATGKTRSEALASLHDLLVKALENKPS